MMNFELCTDADRRDAAHLERRRAQDEERKKRLFGPKSKIYVDHDALTAQIEERKKREKEEKQRDAVFGELALCYANMGKQKEELQKLEQKKLNQAINEFRVKFQKKEDRREADINRTTIEAWTPDDTSILGASSMRKFQGEDEYLMERRKIQNEQTRVWLHQQMDERERAEDERRQAEEAFKAALICRQQQANTLEKLERDCRQQLSMACMDYNKALADERDRLRREEKKEEEQDTLAHKYNVIMSDILLEANTCTDHKGLSKADRLNFLEEQKLLAKEVQDRKELEKRHEHEFFEYSNGVSRTLAAIDADLSRKKMEIARTIAQENKEMGEAHRKRERFLKNVVYTNHATDEFYDQFNKTSR